MQTQTKTQLTNHSAIDFIQELCEMYSKNFEKHSDSTQADNDTKGTNNNKQIYVHALYTHTLIINLVDNV